MDMIILKLYLVQLIELSNIINNYKLQEPNVSNFISLR